MWRMTLIEGLDATTGATSLEKADASIPRNQNDVEIFAKKATLTQTKSYSCSFEPESGSMAFVLSGRTPNIGIDVALDKTMHKAPL